jgi:hypothetical protein
VEEKPSVPITGIVIGDIIYWICILAAFIAMVGPVLSIADPGNNVSDPYKIFTLVWEGKNSDEVWAAVTPEGKYPGPHFWINHLSKGDGITQLGVWLACMCSLPAVFIGGIIYFFQRSVTYLILCWFVTFMITFSMLGIIK